MKEEEKEVKEKETILLPPFPLSSSLRSLFSSVHPLFFLKALVSIILYSL